MEGVNDSSAHVAKRTRLSRKNRLEQKTRGEGDHKRKREPRKCQTKATRLSKADDQDGVVSASCCPRVGINKCRRTSRKHLTKLKEQKARGEEKEEPGKDSCTPRYSLRSQRTSRVVQTKILAETRAEKKDEEEENEEEEEDEEEEEEDKEEEEEQEEDEDDRAHRKCTRANSRKRKAKKSEQKTVKKRKLSKEDMEKLCKDLKSIDIDELRRDVVSLVDTGYHISFFKARLDLWEYIKGKNVGPLQSVLATLSSDFVTQYQSHFKGKNKHFRLTLAWYDYMRQYTVLGNNMGERAWSKLVDGYSGSFNTAGERSCLFSSLLMNVFDEMLRRVQCCLSELQEATTVSLLPSAAVGQKPDDDASLQRLAGFALFSCMQSCKRKLMWRRKLEVTQAKAQVIRTQLAVLKQLVDTEKDNLPAVIYFQDRGNMTFMHSSLLPFVRNVVTAVRKLLNYEQYSKHGKDIFKVTIMNLVLWSIIAIFITIYYIF